MEFLRPYIESVNLSLDQLDLPQTPATLYNPQRYMLSNGGKRIRPVLTLLACGICGRSRKDAMPAALSIELLHNFTLMHDDIMDQAESRRGEMAVHKKWNESVAILSGDSMHTRALLMLHQLPGDVDFRTISRIYLEGVDRVCEGQALDMEFESRLEVTLDDYMEMISGKTGALLATALQTGGLVAGGNQQQLESLKKVGESIGYAFQIQDDWLDVVADPDKFGKRVAGDIYECKKTYLMILALERCNKTQKKWLKQCLRNKPLEDSEVENIISLYSELGVIEDTRAKIVKLYTEAEQSLEIFGESEDKRDLIELIKTLKKRDH